MATFAKKSFDTAIYATFRPTYPRQLFDFVFQHHGRTPGARWDTAVDLGCGTGQATVELTPFKRIIGVDPSAKMIASAREAVAQDAQTTNTANLGRFEFVQGDAENLAFLEDGSVDLLIAAQACHWFDWSKMWPETARVLRTGGTAAFWNYSEFRLTNHPSLTPLITEYAQGKSPADSLGPHWQQPGRSILDNHLTQVPSATDALPGQFTDFKRVYFTGSHYPALPSSLPVIMRKQTTWIDLQQYLRTWSSLHTYHERYPGDLERGDGDISARFLRALKDGVATSKGTPVNDEDTVDLEFPLALMLATKA